MFSFPLMFSCSKVVRKVVKLLFTTYAINRSISATAKAGDDFPFRNPSTNGAGNVPNIQRKNLKIFLQNGKMRLPVERGQTHRQ